MLSRGQGGTARDYRRHARQGEHKRRKEWRVGYKETEEGKREEKHRIQGGVRRRGEGECASVISQHGITVHSRSSCARALSLHAIIYRSRI